MNEKEHQEFMVYLEELLSQSMKIRYSYDWFMKSKYMKLVNDTFSELLVNDALEVGL
jgi:hypothetical protein